MLLLNIPFLGIKLFIIIKIMNYCYFYEKYIKITYIRISKIKNIL